MRALEIGEMGLLERTCANALIGRGDSSLVKRILFASSNDDQSQLVHSTERAN